MSSDADAFLDALRAVADPGGGGDIVSRGRVTAPRMTGTTATLVLDVSGLAPRLHDALEREVRAAAAGMPGISELRVVLTADKVERRIIAVGSGKGGVGKSTVAANIAVALARAGHKVGLVDADIYGPSQPRIMGNNEKPEAVGKQLIPVTAHGVRMLSIGQLVQADSALAWRGPMASNALAQLIEGDWGDTELMVVDLPPGTGDVQLSLIQRWKPAGALIVSTPQDLALIDAARAIDLFRKMDVPILGLVENMSGYACPHCGEVSDPFGSGGAEAAAAAAGIAFVGRIPLKPSIRSASDGGTPPASGEGDDSDIFAGLAARLLEQLNELRR
jgi:ATP-binding protein involved in chromosome partitioning